MKLEVESDKFDMLCGTVQMGSVKLEQESTNVEMESNKLDMSCARCRWILARRRWTIALFAWLISRTFSVNEQYFSLTTNQPTVLSAMAYQPNEQGNVRGMLRPRQVNGDEDYQVQVLSNSNVQDDTNQASTSG